MKRILFCLITVIYGLQVFGQAAVLFDVNGDGIYDRNGVTTSLEIPQSYEGGDVIKVNNGDVMLLLGDGDEVTVNAGNEYKIKPTGNSILSSVAYEGHDTQNQSSSAFKVRGEDVSLMIYPLSSKVIQAETASLVWSFSSDSIVPVTLTIIDLNTGDEVWSEEGLTSTKFDFAAMETKESGSYYWTISDAQQSFEQMGEFSVITQTEKQALPAFELLKAADYLKAYYYYIEHDFHFDAYHILQEANDKYPDIDLFNYLRNKMLSD